MMSTENENTNAINQLKGDSLNNDNLLDKQGIKRQDHIQSKDLEDKTVVDQAKDFMTDSAENLKEGFNDAAGKVSDWAQGAWNSVSGDQQESKGEFQSEVRPFEAVKDSNTMPVDMHDSSVPIRDPEQEEHQGSGKEIFQDNLREEDDLPTTEHVKKTWHEAVNKVAEVGEAAYNKAAEAFQSNTGEPGLEMQPDVEIPSETTPSEVSSEPIESARKKQKLDGGKKGRGKK
jgi:hypothetical protein